MYDWLLVGGGLHGSHIALRLRDACPRAAIAVIDPEPTALSVWQRRANACSMHILRSPQSHHLGLRSSALRTYARQHGYAGEHVLGRYRRPSRALFESHGLAATRAVARINARVTTIAPAMTPIGATWRVHSRDGARYTARNLVLATGPTAPQYPAWGAGLAHVFAPDCDDRTTAWATSAHIAVVGGGISAAQYALARAQQGHAVTLISRHNLRRAEFDGRPCFAGPRCLTPFLRLPKSQRPAALTAARNPASMPSDVYTALQAQISRGVIRWRQGAVVTLTDAGLRLTDGRHISADQIMLATGFAPGACPLQRQLATQLALPLDAHGYAPIDANLAWAPGLYVSGRPASLQLGPMAANIHGARLAGRRLAQVALQQQHEHRLTVTG